MLHLIQFTFWNTSLENVWMNVSFVFILYYDGYRNGNVGTWGLISSIHFIYAAAIQLSVVCSRTVSLSDMMESLSSCLVHRSVCWSIQQLLLRCLCNLHGDLELSQNALESWFVPATDYIHSYITDKRFYICSLFMTDSKFGLHRSESEQ